MTVPDLDMNMALEPGPVRWHRVPRNGSSIARWRNVPLAETVHDVVAWAYDSEHDLLILCVHGGRRVWLTLAGGMWRAVVPTPSRSRPIAD